MRKTQKMATTNVINTTITIFRLSSSKEALVGGLIDGCRVGTGVVMAESAVDGRFTPPAVDVWTLAIC